MYWPIVPQEPLKRQSECRMVCLTPGLAKIASKHGLLYGQTCARLDCTRPVGGFLKFGFQTFRFACDGPGPDGLPTIREP
jgi:hypothetical protein